MPVELERRLQAQTREPSELCFLLVRAPADGEIYAAFRTLAANAQEQVAREELLIAGDVPITSGLTSSAVPPALQRLLDAGCDMIDKLSLEIGDLSITYLRSGGHAPFRESYFDEIRIEARDPDAIDPAALERVIETLNSHLSIASHTATGTYADIIAEASSRESVRPSARQH